MNEVLLVTFAFATSTLTAITGIGGGMMLIAFMPGLLPAAAIVPVHGAVQLFANSSRALFGWRQLQWKYVLAWQQICWIHLNSSQNWLNISHHGKCRLASAGILARKQGTLRFSGNVLLPIPWFT